MIRIELLPLPPFGETLIAAMDMAYVALDNLRRLAAGAADGDGLVRMVEAYNPTGQAVVLARITGRQPITVTLDLPPGVTAAEAPGVH